MRSLPIDTKQNIISSLQQALSIRDVASQCHFSKSAVQRIHANHFSDLVSPPGGRPSKLSPEDKRSCIRGITKEGLGTAVAVAKKLKNDLNIEVSDGTVRRTLNEAGLKAAEKVKKPKLSPKNIKARLEFAKRHKDWTVEDWKHVVWSDETKINRFC